MSKEREIASRVVVQGTLKLITPTYLGNGDADGLLDMPLLRDVLQGLPLLTGTSIAGALRNYLRIRERGYHRKEKKMGLASLLFGAVKEDDDGEQSPLIVDDALGDAVQTEIRDGVKIDYKTRLAKEKQKYDFELLPAGTTFQLRFELLLPRDKATARQMRSALALALHGLESGEIAIGARRTRGFGRCKVESWQATSYDLQQGHELVAWLACEHEWGYQQPRPSVGSASIALGVAPPDEDARHTFRIQAIFNLKSSLLIRSTDFLIPPEDIEETDEKAIRQPDFTHLSSRRGDEVKPIISGTSLAGALRSRATRILNTLKPTKTQTLIDSLFGIEMRNKVSQKRVAEISSAQEPLQALLKPTLEFQSLLMNLSTDQVASQKRLKKVVPTASRLVVEESIIEDRNLLVQNRVAIDRFTGGAFETALFSEAPQFGGQVTLKFSIRDPQPGERGLVLLLLKDLWTSDLALGGSSSVGRGRLIGVHAIITDSEEGEWEIKQADQKGVRIQFTKGDVAGLNTYMTELNDLLEGA